MDVKSILQTVVRLSLGEGDALDEEIQVKYLDYLNRAAETLYQTAAPFDDFLTISEKFTIIDESTAVAPSRPIFLLGKCITQDSKYIFKKSSAHFDEKVFLTDAQMPIFTQKNDGLYFYTLFTKPYNVLLSYKPNFTPLLYTAKESGIPFRPAFHNKLVFGTLYYLYQDMDGFKSSVKEKICIAEWNSAISKYSAFLFNSSSRDLNINMRV